MMSYSSQELVDAELRYRRERLARDWQIHQGGHNGTGSRSRRARTAVAAIATLGLPTRRHRHA
jgi:hypothetical protein